MKTKIQKTPTSIGMWDRVMRLDETMSPTAARALLKFQFTPEDRERMQDLAAKARRGELTETDREESDTFEQMGCLLDILHSKARRVLKRGSRTH
jgi:hypothetical protein